MTVNVYTKEDKVKYIELNVEVGEYFTMEDRILAVSMSDDMNEKNKIELDEFN